MSRICCRVTGRMRECDVSAAVSYLGNRFGGFAKVTKVFGIGDGLVREAEEVFEDDCDGAGRRRAGPGAE